MEHSHKETGWCCCSRRDFLQAAGTAGALAMLPRGAVAAAAGGQETAREKKTPTVRGAFIYPPSQTLREAGYWSWPGSSFDAEGRQRKYMAEIQKIEKQLGMRIAMDETQLDTENDVNRFIADVKQSKPDGLLLILFKKGHWNHVLRIVEETKIPAVVLTTLGILLSGHIRQMHRKPGTYLINAPDDLDAVADGMRMIRAARRLKDSRLVSIVNEAPQEATVPHLGVQIRTVPHDRFVEVFNRLEVEGPVAKLARAYERRARKIVEPSKTDIAGGAKSYFALKSIVEDEKADAVMMDCLPGLRLPHKHVPPCMGFMSLRDEGIPAGCQADRNATLTMMIVQELFGKPGFQQNASMNTEENLYFGAHCTSPSKMNGPDGDAEPIILHSHAEAGWGCVPRVLFPEGQKVTMAQYLSGDKPRMIVYTGQIVRCPPIPPTGGCRTNLEMTINEVDDVCDTQGMHQAIFYGDHSRQLRRFCQLYGIEVVT